MSKFIPGQSGNPSGKKPGTLNKRTQFVKLLEPHAQELIERLLRLANQGDPNALRLCIERLIPRAKDDVVNFEITDVDLKMVDSLLQVGEQIIKAVTNGELTPEEGQKVMGLVEGQRKNIETSELSIRLAVIERTLKHRKEKVHARSK